MASLFPRGRGGGRKKRPYTVRKRAEWRAVLRTELRAEWKISPEVAGESPRRFTFLR
jgi:hypothetical protein